MRSASGRAIGGLATRHREVGATTWKACAGRVPRARQLAGTFAPGSGPNCFSTVLTAAGVPDADHDRDVLERFEAWLSVTCRRVARDEAPGTVLVWRGKDGLAAHAAITLGDGWAFEKPSRRAVDASRCRVARRRPARQPGRGLAPRALPDSGPSFGGAGRRRRASRHRHPRLRAAPPTSTRRCRARCAARPPRGPERAGDLRWLGPSTSGTAIRPCGRRDAVDEVAEHSRVETARVRRRRRARVRDAYDAVAEHALRMELVTVAVAALDRTRDQR